MDELLKEVTEIRKELQNIRIILQSHTGIHATEQYVNSKGQPATFTGDILIDDPELVKAQIKAQIKDLLSSDAT